VAATRDPRWQRFALSEAQTALSGFWQLTGCPWMNPIGPDAEAAHKPWQLKAARAVGLTVPRTMMTNSVEAARSFIAGEQRLVYKPFLQTFDALSETREVSERERGLLESVSYTPVIFQQLIDGIDVRATVIGQRVLAAAAETAAGEYRLDVRFNVSLDYRPHSLPASVEAALIELLALMGLRYGAVDLRLGEDGVYYFLEINPAGQFLYVEQSTGMPIAEALADELCQMADETVGDRANAAR
jgi:glutathione synthase/RimK-type ligase-like ATP-grasp enzyme